MAREVDRYYNQVGLPGELRKHGQTARALSLALDLLGVVPALIRETNHEYGCFNLQSIPPIEEGCILAALLDDERALADIRAVVERHPELQPWVTTVDQGDDNLRAVRAIRDELSRTPGTAQSGLAKVLGLDGRQVSRLVSYLSQAGQVRREMTGQSYTLNLVTDQRS